MKILIHCSRSILLNLNLTFNILHNQTQSYFYSSSTHIQMSWEIYLLSNSKKYTAFVLSFAFVKTTLFFIISNCNISFKGQLNLYLTVNYFILLSQVRDIYLMLQLCLEIALFCLNYISCGYVLYFPQYCKLS